MTHIRIARRLLEKEYLSALPDLHELLYGAVLPLASMEDEELAVAVPNFLRKHQLPFEVWVVHANDVAQYLFKQGHTKAADFVIDKILDDGWLFFWFPKDMCDFLEKKQFN